MAVPSPPAVGANLASSVDLGELQRLLSRVAAVFDIDRMLSAPADQAAVIEYYTQSRSLYRNVHSSAGAIHMALSAGGRFREEDYLEQARRVESLFQPVRPRRVLELGCGTAFNSGYLASRHPDIQFFALDLTPLHLQEARQRTRVQDNLQLVRGDFHRLPWADQAFDLVFEVEAVCHVRDLDTMLAETFRVLSPGGRFVMFDGCRHSHFRSLPEPVQIASRLVEQSMAIQTDLVLSDCMQAFEAAGFSLREQQDITHLALPTIKRLQGKARLFYFWPWMARQLLRWNPAFANTVAVYLMPETIRTGAHVYLQTVMERPPPSAA